IRPATRLLYLNQPHNPTGTLMPRPVFDHVIGLARAHGLVVFSDEVYRELEHDPASLLPAACDEYERAVSLGSISKSYGLPGLRIGWIATRDGALRDAVSVLKDYTTICASAPSELLTALALRNRRVLLHRTLAIVRRTLPLLDGFFERHAETFDWVRPTASPIGFPRVRGISDVAGYCARLAETGVLLLPGSVYDQPEHVRIGFGRANMPDALRLLEANLAGGERRAGYASWTCLTSMAPYQAAGILAAILIAPSRSLQSMTAKPVICSLVPANGPSVVTMSPPSQHRTVAAASAGCSCSLPASAPRSCSSRRNAANPASH